MTDIKEHRNWIAIQVSALRAKFYAPRLDPEVHKAYLVSWADTLQPYSKEERQRISKEVMSTFTRIVKKHKI